ncbi:MAG: hypothetical protein WCS42_06360 [Verrucomicrobiota bacterium]
MAARPDQSASLSAKQAKSPEVVKLFEQLANRAEIYARMQDEFLEGIIRHREARTGKPFRNSNRQQKIIGEFDRDAEQALLDLEHIIAKLDDKALLVAALSSEYQQLRLEGMASDHRPEDREMAQRMIDFRRETIRLIEHFVEVSPFKGQVVSIWDGKQ